MRKAIVDIGTNSTRLLIAEYVNGDWKKLITKLEFTRIGENIGAEQIIKPEALKRTAECVRDYVIIAREAKCEQITVTATSAVRDAKNRDEVCAEIAKISGVNVRVLAGEEEAYLSYRGAVGNSEESSKIAVLDIGGGSTELVWQEGKDLQTHSVAVGAVRLKERPELREKLDEILRDLLPTNRKGLKIVAVGGTATTLAMLDIGLEEYDSERVCGYKLSRDRVDEWLYKMQDMSIEEIRALKGMPAKRADVIVYGVSILSRVLHLLDVEVVWAEDHDLLYALLEE